MKSSKILCVDDDQNVLSGLQRYLRKEFQLDTASDGDAAITMIKSADPYAVVVSDLRMPGMNGIELLIKVREESPDTVRIMLTGNADLHAAIESVNEGNIFRFLTKPCQPAVLVQALKAGIHQYELITGERELLEKTLNGSIRMLTEILSIVDPQSFGRARVLRDLVKKLAKSLKIEDTWELEIAAMLLRIGHVTIPPNIVLKEKAGQELTEVEKEMLDGAPDIAHRLLANIPRLEGVARIVHYQNKRFDGSGFPKNSVKGEDIPVESRILKLLADLMHAESEGLSTIKALEILKTREGWYDPAILNAAYLSLATSVTHSGQAEKTICSLRVKDLKVGQILISDVETNSGTLLIASGNWISETLLQRIKNFDKLSGIKQPIQVEAIQDEGVPDN